MSRVWYGPRFAALCRTFISNHSVSKLRGYFLQSGFCFKESLATNRRKKKTQHQNDEWESIEQWNPLRMRFIKTFAAIAALIQQGRSTIVGETSQYNHIQKSCRVKLTSRQHRKWPAHNKETVSVSCFVSKWFVCFKMINIFMWQKTAEAAFRFPANANTS